MISARRPLCAAVIATLFAACPAEDGPGAESLDAVEDGAADSDSGDSAFADTTPTDDTVPPPGCGQWPLLDLGPAGPGEADLPFGAQAGAVRANSATIAVAGDDVGAVRITVQAGPQCAPVTTPWVAQTDDNGRVAHVSLTGLVPNTRYRYWVEREAGGGLSSARRLVTPPLADRAVRLAFSGDVGTGAGFRDVLDDIITTGADALLFLGDWPYADSSPAAQTLPQFRAKHRSHRAAAEIRTMLRHLPVLATWDDHEITNDWDGADSASTPVKVAAGIQAWREFFPLADAPPGEIYRRHAWGAGIDVFWLDTRSHRDANSAPNTAGKTMLGAVQRQWLLDGLAASVAPFKLIMTSVPLDHGTTGNDHWRGFAAERQALVDGVDALGVDGVIWLTADQHWMSVHHHPSGHKEFQTGPLAQSTRTPPDDVPAWVLTQREQQNYGLLDYAPATADTPATLTFTAWGDGGENLWTETVRAGHGAIEVAPSWPLTRWRLTGAHRFEGSGTTTLPYATPGTYTLTWLSAEPGQPLPPPSTQTLKTGRWFASTTAASQARRRSSKTPSTRASVLPGKSSSRATKTTPPPGSPKRARPLRPATATTCWATPAWSPSAGRSCCGPS